MKGTSLSFDKLNKILLGGSFLFLLIAYQFALSPTFELIGKNSTLKANTERVQQAQQNLHTLEKRMAYVNKQLQTYKHDLTHNHEAQLAVVSDFCKSNKLSLREYPEMESHNESDFDVYTNFIQAEGGFHNLLRLTHHLEHVQKIGRIVSLSFKREKDISSKREVLKLNLYSQNIAFTKKETK